MGGAAELREEMASKLLEKEDEIREKSWTLWKKLGLNQFKTNAEQWQQSQKKQSKAREKFAEFFEETEPRNEVEATLMSGLEKKNKTKDLKSKDSNGTAASTNVSSESSKEIDALFSGADKTKRASVQQELS